MWPTVLCSDTGRQEKMEAGILVPLEFYWQDDNSLKILSSSGESQTAWISSFF